MLFEVDPVCHMNVMPATAAGKYDYKGKTYYFCNPRCLERFRANPEQFLGLVQLEIRTPKAGTSSIYVCPMDPEVRQKGPGACPKCGMALEPETISLEEDKNTELESMTRRFWIAAILQYAGPGARNGGNAARLFNCFWRHPWSSGADSRCSSARGHPSEIAARICSR